MSNRWTRHGWQRVEGPGRIHMLTMGERWDKARERATQKRAWKDEVRKQAENAEGGS